MNQKDLSLFANSLEKIRKVISNQNFFSAEKLQEHSFCRFL